MTDISEGCGVDFFEEQMIPYPSEKKIAFIQ